MSDDCDNCGRLRAQHLIGTNHHRGEAGDLLCPVLVNDLQCRYQPTRSIKGVGPDAPVVTNEAGAKQSHLPYRCDLLPARAVLAVAEVLEQGARKYGPNNWRGIPEEDHVNHALAHLFAKLAGDTSDDHLEHAACRLLMALDKKRGG